MNTKVSKLLVVGLVVGVTVGLLAFLKYGNVIKPQGGVDPQLLTQQQAQEASNETVVFQPEAQMLSQALTVGADKQDISMTPSAMRAAKSTSPDKTITADVNVGPYFYDSQVCKKAPGSWYECMEDYYQGLVKNYGVDVTFDDIKKRYQEDPNIVTQCHPLMHGIGQEASKSYPTVSEAYLHGDSFCWSGYYHGTLEGVVGRIGLKNLPSQLNTICADIPGRQTYNFNYYNCVHGLGHGIMEALNDEVFESLTTCDNLSGSWERQSCYSGVFMENIIANGNNHGSKYLKPSDPLYPCPQVDGPYKSQCYLGQTSYALEVTNYNFAKVFTLCAGVEQPYRDICNQSMGRDAANQARHDAQITKETCWLAEDSNDRVNCIIGAAKEIISYYHSDSQAYNFCNILEEEYKNTCTVTTKDYYSHL